MAYDEKLAERIRRATAGERGVSEKKMFGGIAFLLRGNMFCGVLGSDMMVRVGPRAYDEALARPHAREMDFSGRPMRGLVFVAPQGFATPRALGAWIERGLAFARTTPSKKATKNRAVTKRKRRTK